MSSKTPCLDVKQKDMFGCESLDLLIRVFFMDGNPMGFIAMNFTAIWETTSLKFNIEPENDGFQYESPFRGGPHFQVDHVCFRGCIFYFVQASNNYG